MLREPTFDLAKRHAVATLLLDAACKTTSEDIFHGDLHPKNIIVTKKSIRLLDFGTPKFTLHSNLRRRHLRVLLSTFKQLLHPFDIDAPYDGIFNEEMSGSLYRFFLKQIPYFVMHMWREEFNFRDWEFRVPIAEDTERFTIIHPLAAERL